MSETFREVLEKGALHLGQNLKADEIELMCRHAKTVLEHNRITNLTQITESP